MRRSLPETFALALFVTLVTATSLAAQRREPPPATGTVGRASDPTLVLPTVLKRKVDAWYRTTSRRTGGSWGIVIADERGNLLWTKNPDRPLLPASTVKVFTTSYALGRLGADYTRETRVVGIGSLDSTSGQWLGTWQLQLNGDPTLEDPAGMGPRLYDLAAQLAAQGVRSLAGPMLITSAEQTTADARYPTVWRSANIGSIYAPLIGAVTLHENIVELLVLPAGRLGQHPRIARDMPFGVKDLIVNEAVTRSGRRSRLRLVPMRDGRVALRGYIGNRSGMRQVRGATADPRRVLEVAWAAVLSQAGIRWERESPAMLPPASAQTVVLAEVSSPALDSVVAMTNRRSLNIGAELLLRWAAGWESPADSLEDHIAKVIGTPDGFRIVDGSGMSHEDRVTPHVMATYLARIPTWPRSEAFPFLLPANGAGTLARLRGGFRAPGVVRAKTGTLAGVSTLAGYLGRREGTYIVVAFFNGGRTRRARAAQWQLFRVIGGDGVQIPTDTDFGPTVVSDTLETPEASPPPSATDTSEAIPAEPPDTARPAETTQGTAEVPVGSGSLPAN